MNACETKARKDQEVTINWVVNFYILQLYLRFRFFVKIQSVLRIFSIFWCGFAVFELPLRPPPLINCDQCSYKLNNPPSILFSASGYSRQQTHYLCVGVISHRSQVHQNVPSNRSFASSFSLFAILRRRNTFWLNTVWLKISHDLEYKHA